MQVVVILVGVAGINLSLMGWIKKDVDKAEERLEKFMDSFQQEIKDFHGRLIALETKYLESHRKEK